MHSYEAYVSIKFGQIFDQLRTLASQEGPCPVELVIIVIIIVYFENHLL
jgi:hypothetical protein